MGREGPPRLGEAGVTLVELLVSLGIITVLATIGWLSLPNLEKESQLDLYASEVKFALYQTQSQTVNGLPCGVHFEPNRFVLFEGEAFAEGNPKNQEKILPTGLSLTSINLPNQSITFEKVTGLVKNFLAPTKLTLTDQQTGKTRLIIINRVGMVEIE